MTTWKLAVLTALTAVACHRRVDGGPSLEVGTAPSSSSARRPTEPAAPATASAAILRDADTAPAPPCVEAIDVKPRSTRGCVKPLSDHCRPSAPVAAGEPLAQSSSCPGFADVLAEVRNWSEPWTITRCKDGRIVEWSGGSGGTTYYFDGCDRLIGVDRHSDTMGFCKKTSFTIAFGRTHLDGCGARDRAPELVAGI